VPRTSIKELIFGRQRKNQMRLLSKVILVIACFAVVFVLTPASAKADQVVLTITNPIQSSTAGGTVTFAATLTNPNAQAFTLTLITIQSSSGPGGIVPIIAVLGAGATSPVPGLTTVPASISLTFRVTAAPGTYTGVAFFTGHLPDGADENTNS